MKHKNQYFRSEVSPANNSAYTGNVGSELSYLSIVEKEETSKKRGDTKIRLYELEKLNKHLEELVTHQNKKLIEAKATNSRFLSIIAHDLRSPLSSIIGILEILKESLRDNRKDDFEEYVNIAYDSSYNTLNLLDSLLEWTVSQGKHESFNPVKINLQKLFADEVMNINNSADQKEIKIRLFMPDNLNVAADLQMVRTVFRNLISNSIKFTNPGGEIVISVTKHKRLAEVSVKDNGVGMSSKVLQNLFKIDSFHSTDGTNNEKGTGLGLILCKEFIELHGGKIWIDSEPGKGSETKFTLPLYIL
jgi:signal transduction histidine kinase